MITIDDFRKHVIKAGNQQDINKLYELLEEYVIKCASCSETVFKIDDYALCDKEKCRKKYNV